MTEEQTPQSFIQVVFSELGSTFFDMNIGQVTPLQIYALIGHLKMMADIPLDSEMRQRMAQDAQKNVAVPESMDEILIAR